MKGHEPLIQLRKAGTRPAIVFVNDYPCKTDWHEWGEHATICTSGDQLSSIDFRLLVGLTASISACTEARAKALFEKAKQAGATTVAACLIQPNVSAWEQTGWADIYHKEKESA
jgi:hypothetical protein